MTAPRTAPPSRIEERTVIMLGLSQHGKTMTMNSLLNAQRGQLPAGAGAVGDGTNSCTKDGSIYELFENGYPTRVQDFKPFSDAQTGDKISRAKDEVELHRMRRKFWTNLKKQSKTDDDSDDDGKYTANVQLGQPMCLGCNHRLGEMRGLVPVGRSPLRSVNVEALGLSLKIPTPMSTPLLVETNPEMIRKQKLAGGVASSTDLPAVRIFAIDTPGMDDTEGADDELMQKIIDKVMQRPSLSGLVMVTKCKHTISPSWISQVQRYWNQFPMMQSQWIFVHTQADPYAAYSPERRTQSSYEAMMAARNAKIDEVMKTISGNPNFDALHIYMENDVGQDGGEALKGLMAESHNTLFTSICNFDPIEINELPFQKGPKLLEIDSTLNGALTATIRTITDTLSENAMQLGALLKMRNRHKTETENVEKEMREIREALTDKDHEGPISQTKNVYVNWQWWYHPEEQVEITTAHALYTHTVIDTSGSAKSYIVTTVEVSDRDDSRKRLNFTVKMPYIWTNLRARVVVSTRSRDLYAADIEDLKKRLARAKQDYDEKRATQIDEENIIAVVNDQGKQSESKHKTCWAMQSFLRSTWSVTTYKGMQGFYSAAKERLGNGGLLDSSELLKTFYEPWMEVEGKHLEFQPVHVI